MLYVNKQKFKMSGYPHYDPNAGDGSGTVTSVSTDDSLFGGPITESGTLGIAASIRTTIANTVENVNVLEQKTQHMTVSENETTITGFTFLKLGNLDAFVVSDTISSEPKFAVGSSIISRLRHFFNNGLEPETDLIGSIGLVGKRFANVFAQSVVTDGISATTINGHTASGGVYLLTENGPLITNTTQESSLFSNTSSFVGTMEIPANTQSCAYRFSISGLFSSIGNSVTIRLKSGSFTLAAFPVTLTGSQNEEFSLTIDLTVRPSPGVNDLMVHFHLSYSDGPSTDYRGDLNSSVAQFASGDGPTAVPLDVTVQYSTASTGQSIQVKQAVITKTF